MNYPNIEQIRDYVYNDKPIAGTVAKDWFKYLLNENEQMRETLSEIKGLIPLMQDVVESESLRHNTGNMIMWKIDKAFKEDKRI